MMDPTAEPRVDLELCDSCGRCVAVCAADLIVMGERGAEISGAGPCFVCGHCQAVCPTGAITHPAMDAEGFLDLLAPEERPSVEAVRDLLRRRRSVRQYTQEQVPEETMKELIAAATLAPSALNEQEWHFNVFRDPDHLLRIRRRVVAIYRSVLRMLEGSFSRLMLRVTVGAESVEMLEEAEPLLRRIIEAHRSDEDRILWGAPTLIIVHSPAGDPTSTESSHYAVANMMVMATAMGLGTCVIGNLVSVAREDERLREYLGVPEEHSIDAALVVGYPDAEFCTSVAKPMPPIEIT